MESRDIFNRSRKSIEWEANWIHIGTGKEINKALLEKTIANQFSEKEYIMLKRGRTDSKTIQTNSAVNSIMELIGFENFELWDKEFINAIKFDKIGVMNKSKYAI